MSESQFKTDSPEWLKGYDRGRRDARREPTYGPPRFFALAIYRDGTYARKSGDFCEGYETGYDEARR